MTPLTPWIKQINEKIKSKLGKLKPSSTISKLAAKLRNHAYRKAFVASQINIGIPFQIRALMKARGWTQKEMADRTGMLQPRISAMLKPGKVRPNIETLRRFAEAFDCALVVRFAPFSELVRWSDSFDPETFYVPSFDDDLAFGDEVITDHVCRDLSVQYLPSKDSGIPRVEQPQGNVVPVRSIRQPRLDDISEREVEQFRSLPRIPPSSENTFYRLDERTA